MKINKNQLKSLIKECLVEIFQENFNVGSNTNKQNIMATKKVVESNVIRKQIPQISTTKSQSQILQNKKNNNASKNQNDIMKSILEDTARTTFKNMSKSDYEFNKSQLVEEYSAVNSTNLPAGKQKKQQLVPGDTAEDIVSNNDPKNLFGEEASNKWLKLAFAEKTSNNNYEE